MFPNDRRKMAIHMYSLLSSLRKVAILLNVSHMTVSRWLKHQEKKKYCLKDKSHLKSVLIVETIRAAISSNPFITVQKMKEIILEVFKFTVSRELIRTVISKCGMSRKKARFFSKPSNLESKTNEFVRLRDLYISEKRTFVSMDETSFGRHGKSFYGYAPKGEQLRIKRTNARITTTSSLVVVSENAIIKHQNIIGSYNTLLCSSFLSSLDLISGSVIILDNVSFHHSKLVKQVADEKGFILLFSPPYSPWFNPVEGVFSIIKRDFYKHGSIDHAFKTVTTEHCKAFFNKSMSEK